jgi:competence protein ComEC
MPLLWVSLAFISGILLGNLAGIPFFVWLILAGLALFVPILLRRVLTAMSTLRLPSINLALQSPRLPLITACVIAAFLGAARIQSTVPTHTISQIAWFNDRQYDVLVTGTLIEPPDYRDSYTNLRLQVQQVDTGQDQFKVSGLLLARVGPNEMYHYGDVLRLRGRLETPPQDEDFSYRDYLARQGIRSYMSMAEVTLLPGTSGSPILAAVYALKEQALANVYRLFLDPEASFLAGVLLGVDSGLSSRLQQAFIDTGTAHIIAISGFNIAVIAGVFVLLFSRLLGPRRGALAAVIGIAFYTILVGAGPSVVRAALMGTLALLAVQIGRRQQGLNTLAFVAAVMAIWNPLILWDVGFQLSFFATLGLILYGEPLRSAAENFMVRHFAVSDAQKNASLLSQFVLLTFAAQITTLPIMAYQFQQISLISFIANPFILPAQPAVEILGGLAVVVSLIIYPLGQLAAWIAWPLTAYTIRMVELFDRVPHGVIYLGGFSLVLVVLLYAALFSVTLAGPRLKQTLSSLRKRFPYVSVATVLVALFVCAAFAWRLVSAAPDGKLHITFLNVGSADAVLLKTPAGRSVLIDGGPSVSSASDALGRRLPPLDHSLDWLVLASTDEDQVASLPRLLPRYPPRNVLLGANAQASFSSRLVMQWLADEAIPAQRAEAGQTLDLGNGAVLKVVHVSSRGATLLVEWKTFRLLLPIGENLDTLDQLQNGGAVGPVNVLLLAQSGYAPLTPPLWLQNLNPQLVVISVAAADKDGLPDKATLDALAGYSVLRTDLNGWIEVATDGKQMWVEDERK